MHPISWLKGVGIGAAAMFYLDPRLGRRRQALAKDQLAHATARGIRWFDAAKRDLSNRASGVWHEALGAIEDSKPATDEVICARVRSKLGRAVSHPRAIEVDVADGTVSLRGPILADEAECLLACVQSVRGVCDVQDELSRHDSDEGIAELQGEGRNAEGIPMLVRSPGLRLAAGSLGMLMMANCAVRRRPMSIILGAAGFGMLLQAFSAENASAQRLAAGRSRRGATLGEEQESDELTDESSMSDESDDDVEGIRESEPNAAAEEGMQGAQRSDTDDVVVQIVDNTHHEADAQSAEMTEEERSHQV